jgi:hypothetical protein
MCCRKGGTLSVPGVYIGTLDKIPFGAATLKVYKTFRDKEDGCIKVVVKASSSENLRPISAQPVLILRRRLICR